MATVRTRARLHAAPSAARASAHSIDELRALVLDRMLAAAQARGAAQATTQEREAAAGRLDAAVEALALQTEAAREELASLAIELALEIARQFLCSEVDAGHMQLERVVRACLADSGAGRGDARVHLHPDDLAALEGVPFRDRTVLAADETLERGDVHVETPLGLLVREREAVLAAVRERLSGSHT